MKHNKTYNKKLTKREEHLQRITIACFIALFSVLSIYDILTSNYTSKQVVAIKEQQATTTKQIAEIKKEIKDIKVVAIPIKYAKTNAQKEVEFQIRTIAERENFKWVDYLVRLSLYESSLNPQAINDRNRNGSVDYGLFQWNSKNPPISGYTKECYMSIECSTKITMDAINKGYQNHWMANEVAKKK